MEWVGGWMNGWMDGWVVWVGAWMFDGKIKVLGGIPVPE